MQTKQPTILPSSAKSLTLRHVDFSRADYDALARKLFDQIGDKAFWSGQIVFAHGDFLSTLTATLIVYRKEGEIVDLVPVWWDITTHSADQNEEELLCDFSLSELIHRALGNN